MTTVEAIKACAACDSGVSRDRVTVEVRGSAFMWFVVVEEHSDIAVLGSTYTYLVETEEEALAQCLKDHKDRLRRIVEETAENVARAARLGIQAQSVLDEVKP